MPYGPLGVKEGLGSAFRLLEGESCGAPMGRPRQGQAGIHAGVDSEA